MADTNTLTAPDTSLRSKRVEKYTSMLPLVTINASLRTDSGKLLKAAPIDSRRANFRQFVKLYFIIDDHPNNTNPDSSDYGYPTTLRETSSGYQAFSRFADTDYGSAVIREMIDNPTKYKDFEILQASGMGAVADYMQILLPNPFPARKKFNGTFGQDVYDLAVLYHEFAHTSVFRSPASEKSPISILDERDAVIYHENPVRLSKNYEPRYTYTTRDKTQTINIITREIGNGVLLTSKNDPTKLVDPNATDALR